MNPNVKNLSTEILSNNWYTLKKVTYDYLKSSGNWQIQTREAYDRGNGAGILLYNKKKQTVILTKQFRLPTYINGNDSGMLIEVSAGLLNKDNPEECARREAEEETGYKVSSVRKVMEAYMSPGSVTEVLYLFIAEYDSSMKINEGGGIEHEQEDIEVMELAATKAIAMMESGEIKDAKTIMLLQYMQLHNVL